jgi:hypothetical protein
VYKGLKYKVKRVINAMYSSPRGIHRGLFIGVVKGSGNNVRPPPNYLIYIGYMAIRALQLFYTINYFTQDLSNSDTCSLVS